jgi:hypothetical protein
MFYSPSRVFLVPLELQELDRRAVLDDEGDCHSL